MANRSNSICRSFGSSFIYRSIGYDDLADSAKEQAEIHGDFNEISN